MTVKRHHQITQQALDALGRAVQKDLNELRKDRDQLYEALIKAQEDINWMINNNQFLNPQQFEYIDKVLAKAE